MEKCIENLNFQGIIAYQMKCANALIEHFGYDYEEWREIMEYISDYTWLVCTFDNERGLRAESERLWSFYSDKYCPADILMPDGIPQMGRKELYFPCNNCNRYKAQLADHGASHGLCLNVMDCKYVKESYRFHNEKGVRSEGIYKKNYELYLRTDFRLLRVINNIFSINRELSYELEDGVITFVWDSLKALDELGIPHPDCSDIHEYAFGLENETKRFSSLNLIRNEN